MSLDDINKRMDRIENKIDKLTDSLQDFMLNVTDTYLKKEDADKAYAGKKVEWYVYGAIAGVGTIIVAVFIYLIKNNL